MVLHPDPLGSLLPFLHSLPQVWSALPQTAYTVRRNIFLWGLLSSGTAGQQEQRASVPASSHLHAALPSLASDWQGNIKTQPFSSGQSNSEVWPTLNNSPAGLKILPSTWSEASPWPGFCLSQTLTNFSRKHFPVSHLHRQSLSQTTSERWIYSLYSFGLSGSVQTIDVKQAKTNKSELL